jgi:hypothetical protein
MNGQQYPWCQDSIPIILDVASQNIIDCDKLNSDLRLTAIIHRAGHGIKLDTLYQKRRALAKSKGLLWGLTICLQTKYHWRHR